jgi:hypothetical protein
LEQSVCEVETKTGNAKDGNAGLSTDKSQKNEFDQPHKDTDGMAKK